MVVRAVGWGGVVLLLLLLLLLLVVCVAATVLACAKLKTVGCRCASAATSQWAAPAQQLERGGPHEVHAALSARGSGSTSTLISIGECNHSGCRSLCLQSAAPHEEAAAD